MTIGTWNFSRTRVLLLLAGAARMMAHALGLESADLSVKVFWDKPQFLSRKSTCCCTRAKQEEV